MTESLDIAARLALRLASATDDELDDAVTAALGMLAEHAQADRTYVTQYYDDGTFENSHEWTVEGALPQMPAIQRLRSADYSYSFEMARRDEVLSAPDLMALPAAAAAEKRSFSSFGVEAVLQVPITVNGECLGLIGFNNYAGRPDWPDEVIEFARSVAQAVGVAISRLRSAASVRLAYEAAERASRAKDELLAQVSHELRTPLHAMLGYAELLELEARTDDDRAALSQIQYNGRRLLTMVEDLLVLADPVGRDGGAETMSLATAAAAAVEQLSDVAKQRDIALHLRPGLPEVPLRDRGGRLLQVLYCALSGSIQSIDRGGSIVIDSVGDGQIRLDATADQAFREVSMGVALARVLLEADGEIDVVRSSDRAAHVTISVTD